MTKYFDPEARHIRLLALLATIFVAALIAYLSLTSSDAAPRFQWSDKVHHFVAYTALTAPLAAALGRGRLFWAIVAAGLYGLMLEFAQGWLTESRVPSVLDAAANWAGACAGVAIAIVYMRVMRIRRA